MFFTSDNASGAAPEIIAAVARANEGFARSYGADAIMARVQSRIRDIFEAPEAVVHLVATGTAANALALAIHAQPWSAILAHADAHVARDECGAPEFYANGAKMIAVAGAHGRMTAETVAAALTKVVTGDVHSVQRGILSITNLTEAGTLYTAAEVAALTAVAREAGFSCHLDGARFANALIASGATPAEMTWKAGIDVLSFGGTKNGCLGVEAVVLFDPARAWEFELRRKRGGHLLSKGRYLAAQILAMLEGNRWLEWATHANAMAHRLTRGLAAKGVSCAHPVDANILFPLWPAGTSARLRAVGAGFYDMPGPEGMEGARLVTSWATSEAEVRAFLDLF